MIKKYAINPGWIKSRTDGDLHYISVPALADLYHLRRYEYIVWDSERPETYFGRNPDDYIHLYPRSDGNYEKE